jgi:hypothetical protein
VVLLLVVLVVVKTATTTIPTTIHVEAGFRQNASLQRVPLNISNVAGNLGVMISGLEGHASLNDLSIHYKHPDVHVYTAIVVVFLSTPLLEKLQVCKEHILEARIPMTIIEKRISTRS